MTRTPPLRSFIAGMVWEFHDSFGLPIGDATRSLNKLRADLIREEAKEAADALECEGLQQVAKELADLVIVAYGAALTMGIDLDKALLKVHESNMSKLVDGKPVMRPDGKVLKGPNYLPPDMSRCVMGWEKADDADDDAEENDLRSDPAWNTGSAVTVHVGALDELTAKLADGRRRESP